MLKEPAFDLRLENLERLTSAKFVTDLAASAIEAIKTVAEAGHPLVVLASGGKDSTVVTCLTIAAMQAIKASGMPVPPLYMLSSDTGIENPEVLALLHETHRSIVITGEEQGFEVHSHIVRPRLSERWWVGIIGGDQMPSFPDGRAHCSVDMKIAPMSRAIKAIQKEVASRGFRGPVTLLGTRFDESRVRGASMMARGESSRALREATVGGVTCQSLSPICEWSAESVWAYLQGAGTSGRYPGYRRSFNEIYALYDAAAGGECVLVETQDQVRKAEGCGSGRFGCHQCARVKRDRSVENMLLLPEFEYLRPLHDLREYMRLTRFGLQRRRWLGRSIDDETGALAVFPNAYSAEECASLLRMVLTIDRQERERAASESQDPRFQNLTLEDVVAIDFRWSMNGLHRPHEALRIWREIGMGRGLLDVPHVHESPKVEIPDADRLPGDQASWNSLWGRRDVMLESLYFDHDLFLADGGRGSAASGSPHWRDSAHWEIDQESLGLFERFELDERLAETEPLTRAQSTAAARYYLRLGLVGYPRRMGGTIDRQMRYGQYSPGFDEAAAAHCQG